MTSLVSALPFVLAGAALATIHFGALALNVALFTTADRHALAIVVLLTRLALTIAGFVAIIQFGALPLIFAAIGFAAARPLVMRWIRITP